jgi:hypothetical protein
VYCITLYIAQKRGDVLNPTKSIPVPAHQSMQRVALAVLFAGTIVACGKTPGGPTPPHSPPKPQISAGVASHVQKAVFSYTGQRRIQFQYQDPTGPKTPKLIIQT